MRNSEGNRVEEGPKTECVCCSECDYYDMEVCGHKKYAGEDCPKCKNKLRKYSGHFIIETSIYPGANFSIRSMKRNKEFIKDEVVEYEVERVDCSKCTKTKIKKETLHVIDDIYVCEWCMTLHEKKKDPFYTEPPSFLNQK